MENKSSISLIDGVFTPEEAREVVLKLLDYKINFHKIKNFCNEEKCGESVQASLDRIDALRASKAKFEALLESEDSAINFEITSEIVIKSTVDNSVGQSEGELVHSR
jgi:hypothetical protein